MPCVSTRRPRHHSRRGGPRHTPCPSSWSCLAQPPLLLQAGGQVCKLWGSSVASLGLSRRPGRETPLKSNYTQRLRAHSWPVPRSSPLRLKVTVTAEQQREVSDRHAPKGRPRVRKLAQAQSGDEYVPPCCASVSLRQVSRHTCAHMQIHVQVHTNRHVHTHPIPAGTQPTSKPGSPPTAPAALPPLLTSTRVPCDPQ